jgi:hypothetical protein
MAEFILLGAILTAGIALNTATDTKKTVEYRKLVASNDEDSFENVDELPLQRAKLDKSILEFNEDRIKRFRDSFFPENSGVIAPGYSQRNLFNPNQSQRRHDLFTGKDQTYIKKQGDQQPFFQPRRQNIDSSGREGNSEYNSDTSRFSSSLATHQNTLPFQQIRVGRGIGTNESTSDGFHYGTNRVAPIDAYAHKSKELPGNLPTTGGRLISDRPVEPVVQQNRPGRVWSQGADESSRIKFTRQKAMRSENQMARGEFSSSFSCKPEGEFYLGGDYRPGGATNQIETTRVDDRTSNTAMTNLRGLGAAPLRGDIELQTQNRRANESSVIGLGYRNSARTLAPMSAPCDTNRDVSNRLSKTVVSGPAGPAVFRQERDSCSGKQLLREAKRATYSDDIYVPGADAGRATAMRNAYLGFDANPYIQQQHKLKQTCQKPRVIESHMNSYAAREMTSSSHLGKPGGNVKKMTGEIPRRNDFGLGISEQLSQNPYHIK